MPVLVTCGKFRHVVLLHIAQAPLPEPAEKQKRPNVAFFHHRVAFAVKSSPALVMSRSSSASSDSALAVEAAQALTDDLAHDFAQSAIRVFRAAYSRAAARDQGDRYA